MSSPQQIPHRTATIGMLLFLATLTILFAASLVAYIYIRLSSSQSPPTGTLSVPRILWLSTVVIFASSITLSRALAAVRKEKIARMKMYLHTTLILTIAFIAMQTPAMLTLLREHRVASQNGMGLFGFIFVLILLHAAHVVGGLVQLVLVEIGAARGSYDHEHHTMLRNAAWYWHFLDAVWLVMFTAMIALG